MDKRDINAWTRWLHNYLSMFSYAALLFFSVTGITLNHPDWLAGEPQLQRIEGEVNPVWVAESDTIPVSRLEIVEHLRNTHNIKASLKDFYIDERECSISFRGPGYVADTFIDRSTGSYVLMITAAGYTAILNDLHKGRDTGSVWAVVIDISAILMILVSLTGFVMILFIKKRKSSGLILALIGTVLLVILYYLFV